MKSKSINKLLKEWKKEEKRPFTGWDFSYITDRGYEEKPSWNYDDMVRKSIPGANSLLDLGTGGGERLLRFKDIFPPRTAAAEQYKPNLKLARERLEPLRVQVIEADDGLENLLPFENESFGLIIDRHTAFNISEVERVLKPCGIFLTEQERGDRLTDLIEAFDSTPPWPFFTLDFVLQRVKSTNLIIEIAQDWSGKMVFRDIGALVYYLKAVPWVVRGFSVERHQSHLLRMKEKLDREGELSFTEKKFLLKTRKP